MSGDRTCAVGDRTCAVGDRTCAVGDDEPTEVVPYVVYLIRSNRPHRRTYIGSTNNFEGRRLRQHNGELVGGAKYTRVGRPWACICTVSGFRNHIEALQFEWDWKHARIPSAMNGDRRINQLHVTVCKSKWTSHAPSATDVPLTIHWRQENTFYHNLDWPKHVLHDEGLMETGR